MRGVKAAAYAPGHEASTRCARESSSAGWNAGRPLAGRRSRAPGEQSHPVVTLELVEAGGVEPPSKENAPGSTTSVVCVLSLAPQAPTDGILRRQAAKCPRRAARPFPSGNPVLVSPASAPPEGDRADGCHLGSECEIVLGVCVFCRFLRGQRRLGSRSLFRFSLSKPVAPISMLRI